MYTRHGYLLFWCGPCDIIMPSSTLLSNMLLLIIIVNILSIFLISDNLLKIILFSPYGTYEGVPYYSHLWGNQDIERLTDLLKVLLSKIQYWTVLVILPHRVSSVPNIFIWISFPLKGKVFKFNSRSFYWNTYRVCNIKYCVKLN